MKLNPLADRVVVKMVELEETTKSGIILTASAKEKTQVAEVLAVGPGELKDGARVPMSVKVGDKVVTSEYCGTKIKLDGTEYVIISESDISILFLHRRPLLQKQFHIIYGCIAEK